ncbi:MAG: hypothetical protein ACKVQW_02120 [Pyrinomonadaceae bacterium]
MKHLVFFFSLLTFSINVCSAQVNQTPQTRRSGEKPVDRTSKSADRSFEALRTLDVPQTFNKTPLEVLGQDIQPLYRKPGKKDLKDLSPSENVLSRYQHFLKQSNSGIFKLSSDTSCANNLVVTAASGQCAANKVPGGGTAYSFRFNSHRLLHLADITLEKDVLKTDGARQQGLMVSLGDLDLEQVTTETRGLRYLLDFKPGASKAEMQRIDQQLSTGIEVDGFIYRLGFYVETGTTFALRSIAYRGKLMRSVKGVVYDEMDYDKRKDILVVFRIVEKDPNGDITVVWRELSRKDAPVLQEN